MKRDQVIETRQTMVAQLPLTGEILRGSLIERTVRHTTHNRHSLHRLSRRAGHRRPKTNPV
jgi:hypothetical protein